MAIKNFYYLCVICLLMGGSYATSSQSNATTSRTSSSQTGNHESEDTDDQEPFLRFVGELRDQKLTSGDKVQFKCRVEARPNRRMTYTWYKDEMVLTQEIDHRVSIRNKRTGTRLTIKNLLTSDSGEYRCEASNGLMRIHRTANLRVSFKLPPVEDLPTKIPNGRCEIYHGKACADLLSGKTVYIDPFLSQDDMEGQITSALNHITNTKYVSSTCEHLAYPAFCNFVFSPCQFQRDPNTGEKKAGPIKLCREDCELMKYDVCADEYLNNKNDKFLQQIFQTANCSLLPPTTAQGTKCTKIGLDAVSDNSHQCYNGSGQNYRGVKSKTITGKSCQPWSSDLVIRYKELAGGHNFCRNPGNRMSKPWCYTDSDSTQPEECFIQKCAPPSSGSSSDLYIILIPSITIPFVFCCIAAVFCICRKKSRRKNKNPNGNVKHTMGTPIDMTNLNIKKQNLPELNATLVHLLQEIGDGVFGKVYKGRILPNSDFNPNYPVAIKTLRDGVGTVHGEEFQRELNVLSQFQHENVACLKAIVIQPSLRCIIFEFTDNVDLQEYLVSHSPQADFAKPSSTAGSQVSFSIEQSDFIRMATQIASGMEYLTSNNYIHRDLAARNVLICGNMDLKISNLGVLKDSHLSCYYRSPKGGQMLPIRWMAPESLQNWQFSDKSPVWSFGVLLWELFSYGSHPYCGYSNHEVLDMISHRQLLPCPDQCPAKIYSLMHECWTAQPMQRPHFKDLCAKLQGWNSSANMRITSQLAQEINRQTSNVNNDQPPGLKYNRFYQTSSIGGSSGITYSSAIVPSPSPPPPQYSASMQFPPSSSSMSAHLPPPPTFISAPHENYIPNQITSFPSSTAPSHHTQSQTSSNRPYTDNYADHLQDDYNSHHQRRGPFYRRGPASHSSLSSSCSSSRDNRVSHPVRRPERSEVVSPDSFNSPPFSGPGNRSLNGVMENEIDSAGERQHMRYLYSQRSRSPQSNQFENDNQLSPSSPFCRIDKPESVPQNPKTDKAVSSDVSSGSAKAVSCDSGLPTEEADVNTMDPNAPLLQRPPIAPKSSLRIGPGKIPIR